MQTIKHNQSPFLAATYFRWWKPNVTHAERFLFAPMMRLSRAQMIVSITRQNNKNTVPHTICFVKASTLIKRRKRRKKEKKTKLSVPKIYMILIARIVIKFDPYLDSYQIEYNYGMKVARRTLKFCERKQKNNLKTSKSSINLN